MIEFASEVSSKINISKRQVEAVLELFAEGATIPFIARYRKDKTGEQHRRQHQSHHRDQHRYLLRFSCC